MKNSTSKNPNHRFRLSIDLDAYPEVKDMLLAAQKATGDTYTTIIVEALKSKLPEVIKEISEQRQDHLESFLKKYSNPTKI